MNWKYKAFLQQVFSVLPFGEEMNYFFQKKVTKSLPSTLPVFIEKINEAKKHFEVLNKYDYYKNNEDVVFYEFGAGQDLMIPLIFYSLGISKQILTDIRSLARIELINHTIKQFKKIDLGNIKIKRTPDQYLDGKTKKECLSQLKQYYGIEYLAPCDARNTHLESNSINFITSTNTLEHIPPQDIQAILKECYRLLKPGGMMSFIIDYRDHYSFFDKNISVYNFLRYSDFIWKIFNPSLHYQNRLRHKDYFNLIKSTEFTILEEHLSKITEDDIKKIKKTNLAKIFEERYRIDELTLQYSHMILEKEKIFV
jgi:SAM-dependent methyltransferase